MSSGDGFHSFGHGEFCHWCGRSGNDREIDKPCDERDIKKPTAEVMAAYAARIALGEKISDIASLDYASTESITWDEMIARIQALRPAEEKAQTSEVTVEREELNALRQVEAAALAYVPHAYVPHLMQNFDERHDSRRAALLLALANVIKVRGAKK